MDYYKVSVTSSPDKRNIIIAHLSQLQFEGFEENDFGFRAYIREKHFNPSAIEALSSQYDFCYKYKLIPDDNWNAIWESNFKPIQIGQFCGIRADFHPPFTNIKHEILINPKMAFGTGHHETTQLVIELMQSLNLKNARVFDYGCGTGILGILASRMGAASVIAIDNDPLSVENTRYNCNKNRVNNMEVQLGEIAVIPARQTFDLILANINRNVILDSLPALFQQTNSNGKVLISGFLQNDIPKVSTKAEDASFHIEHTATKGEWVGMQLTRS